MLDQSSLLLLDAPLFSVILVTLIATLKVIYNKSFVPSRINLAIVYLDNDNHYLSIEMRDEIDLSEEIKLEQGYKLNHFNWCNSQQMLFLFLKPQLNCQKMIARDRVRHLTLTPNLASATIHENYKE